MNFSDNDNHMPVEPHIEVNLFATLRRYLPENAGRYPIGPETTVRQILDSLHIPPKEAKLIFVNSVKRSPDHVLAPGDRLGIFPPVGGG